MKKSKLKAIEQIAKEVIKKVKRMRGTTMLWGAFAQETTGTNPLKKKLKVSSEEREFQQAVVKILEVVTGKSLAPVPSVIHLKGHSFSENSCWPHFACDAGDGQCGLSNRDWLEAVEIRTTSNLRRVTCRRCQKLIAAVPAAKRKSGRFSLPNRLEVVL